MSIEEYFRRAAARGIIDFDLRIQIEGDGRLTFYVHPEGRDGVTMDYVVRDYLIIPKSEDAGG